jgi:hypothetical protein
MGFLAGILAFLLFSRREGKTLKPFGWGRRIRLLFAWYLRKFRFPNFVVNWAQPAPFAHRRIREIRVINYGEHSSSIDEIMDRYSWTFSTKQIQAITAQARRDMVEIARREPSLTESFLRANYFSIHPRRIVLYR